MLLVSCTVVWDFCVVLVVVSCLVFRYFTSVKTLAGKIFFEMTYRVAQKNGTYIHVPLCTCATCLCATLYNVSIETLNLNSTLVRIMVQFGQLSGVKFGSHLCLHCGAVWLILMVLTQAVGLHAHDHDHDHGHEVVTIEPYVWKMLAATLTFWVFFVLQIMLQWASNAYSRRKQQKEVKLHCSERLAMLTSTVYETWTFAL